MAFGGLLLVSVLLDDLAARIRVPGILMVLLLGLLIENHVGVVGDQQITLLSLNQAQQISQAALVLVLFFGGLTTNWSAVRTVIKPAARLATVGVIITAALIGWAGFGLSAASGVGTNPATLPRVLFVGAMVASTDASAVLVLLRPLAGRLPKRLIDLIECESGFNDPMAVVLAGLALALAGGDGVAAGVLVTDVVRQFVLGILLGFHRRHPHPAAARKPSNPQPRRHAAGRELGVVDGLNRWNVVAGWESIASGLRGGFSARQWPIPGSNSAC